MIILSRSSLYLFSHWLGFNLTLNRSLFPNDTQQQCDLIGQLIAVWATFENLWQQLFRPNWPHFYKNFGKVSKCFVFLVKHFWATFTAIWRLFTGHTEQQGNLFHSKGRTKLENKKILFPCSLTVWPDLAKCHLFGIMFKTLAILKGFI